MLGIGLIGRVVSEIQQNVLDQETLLLEYALGEEKSFLFAVTPQSIAIFELPKRETVEAAARVWPISSSMTWA